MNFLSSVLLGVIQGLTEFLPISSSGHLVLAQHVLPGFDQPGILFDIVLHAGTLVAVLVYFYRTIIRLKLPQIVLLAIGTIPAGLLGFLFEDLFVAMFGDVRAIGLQLIITGILCYLIDRARTTRRTIHMVDALIIGLAQAVAIVPGISRSGATIFAATARGIDRQDAANFSFLLSIPAIGGAVVLQLVKYGATPDLDITYYVVGFIVAMIFGLLSIRMLLNLLVTKNFKFFAVYCFIVGSLAIFLV